MPSNFDAEKRRLLHQKSQQLTTGYGKPNNESGKDGDIAFRQIDDSGTVQYLKANDEWVAVSSSGLMPPQRIMAGGGSSSTTTGIGGSIGVSDHGYLSGRGDDDHSQYVHISTARTISASHVFTGTPTFTNGTFASIDINGGTIDGTTISADSTQTEWDSAHTHISEDGSSHTFIDQTVVSGAAPTFSANNFSDGGSNAIVTITQETSWDNHVADSSQAHSDYLINNGNDVTSGTLQINGTLTLGTGSITDSSGAITFDNENLSTTGTLGSGTITVADGGSINLQEQINFTGASLFNQIRFPDNIESALLIGQGTTPYVAFNSVNGSEKVIFVRNVNANLNVVIDGNLDVDGITNLDVVDIDGTVDMATTLTVAGIVDITNITDSSDDSGDTGALRVEGGASIAKKLYVGTDLDVDGVSNLDVVDIDGTVQVDNDTTTVDSSGAITFTAGASSRWDTTGSLTLDTSSDINFDAASGIIKMKKQNSTRLQYKLDSTPEIVATGDFTLQGSGSITADSVNSFVVKVKDNQTIRSDYSTGMLYLKEYDGNNLWDAHHYAINSAAQFNHFTTGYGDLYQNFSILCKQTIPDDYEDYLS